MNRSPVRSRTFAILAATALLGILFAQAMTAIPRLSITFDEDLHIATGYNVLRTGSLHLIEDHPPLLSLWMSWPLLLSSKVPDLDDLSSQALADRRLFVRNQVWWDVPIDLWIVPPRVLNALLAVLMGAFLFRWAAEWFGPRAGLLALALLAFDPNVLALATVATLDLGVVCLMFIALYWLQRLLRQPSRRHLVAAGVCLGLALAAKISAVLLLLISVGLMLLWGATRWSRRALAGRLTGLLGIAFLTLWAAHLFDFGPAPGLPFPVPAPTYWRSFLRVGQHALVGNRTYLLGETYTGGRWYYFPVVMALKTPLPTLALLSLTLVAIWRRPRRWWRELMLASLPVAYFAVSLMNEINLGYRHILPLVPFLYLSAGRLALPGRPIFYRLGRPGKPLGRAILVLLVSWQVAGTLAVWPFHLTFANEVAGGPQGAYRHMADSNVDWGQGLKALRAYLAQRPELEEPRLSSFVFFIRPELYGVEAEPLPPLADAPAVLPARFNPAPGTYVISASTLRGLKLVDPDMYNWFWHREPDDLVANAMLVYHVPAPDPPPTWLAQCGVPVVPLTREMAAERFGRDDLRQIAFDCTTSWVYPAAGDAAGWFVLHRQVAAGDDPFIRNWLDLARVSFVQHQGGITPPLVVYEWNPAALAPERAGPVWSAPADWPPSQVIAQGDRVTAPISLDGPLTFSGYDVAELDESIALITYWQVDEQPTAPISIMGHLIDAAGQPLIVGDGLGVPWHQLQPGDLLVQRHDLSLPADLPPGTYWLHTGAYQLETLERFPVLGGDALAADRLLLTTVEVR
ncbi:MAG: glycosyltransferase family 39 protein [Anaerolineae bacterium]|jgi:hypothetical protein